VSLGAGLCVDALLLAAGAFRSFVGPVVLDCSALSFASFRRIKPKRRRFFPSPAAGLVLMISLSIGRYCARMVGDSGLLFCKRGNKGTL
jgi:hypothetical protein